MVNKKTLKFIFNTEIASLNFSHYIYLLLLS